MAEWMSSAEIRRANLRWIAARYGNDEVCRRLDFSRQRLSALISQRSARNVGDDVARKIEKAFSLPRGWLDSRHPEDPALIEKLNDVLHFLSTRKVELLLQFALAMRDRDDEE